MSLDKINNIEKISKSLKTLHADEVGKVAPQGVEPNQERFKALMQEDTLTAAKTESGKEAANKPTLMEEARKTGGKVDPTRATGEDIVVQTQTVIKRIDTVKDKLATPNLEIKPSVRTMMRKKLHHIDENIKTALSKAGETDLAAAKAPAVDPALSPVHRFLGMLAHGQDQLDHLSTTVETIATRKDLSPAAMLAIQIKVNRIQQEVELFTSLLNKALESTKTIMNVQV